MKMWNRGLISGLLVSFGVALALVFRPSAQIAPPQSVAIQSLASEPAGSCAAYTGSINGINVTVPYPLDSYVSQAGDKISKLTFYKSADSLIAVGLRGGIPGDTLRKIAYEYQPGDNSQKTDVRFEPLGDGFYREAFTIKDSSGSFSYTKIIYGPNGQVRLTTWSDPNCIDVRR